ncbi:hypothetical protein M378DRAFT_187369 [Amanita muscaria Koide BX008]|uniref:3-beta hydroxysteroid dehydrogenase/isomerase domain-containing protein n=1 Tax=Amanita muscaria (strain Koide BX008) TaxID=946122 RepID=A0A0C2WZG5_AMAMK|nr:hypothetical protein M378DRAFT_187369 [Amanita muscaria Koide BX008]
MMMIVLLTLSVLLALLVLYIRLNDRKLSQIPRAASQFSPTRVSPQHVQPPPPPVCIKDQIPPKTGRRYIVVGGGGFLGGWIVHHLIQRGEDPSMIRVLDLFPSERKDAVSDVAFFKVDISDSAAVLAAFTAPWPAHSHAPLTVFHTAASIRFYERHPDLLSRSVKVNVHGTKHVLAAARAIGATILVYTSSGSTSVRRSRFWLSPWEREPRFFVQVINDVDHALFPKRHDQFFSNYAASKAQAEKIVRAADKTLTYGGVFRTGCIRPGNGIFGPGDILCHSYLRRATNPTWVSNILQSFVYVENCVCAHLCYEQRLIELEQQRGHPDIGGDAFTVADPGPPATFGDLYTTIETLTAGKTRFTHLSPTAMLLFSHLIELYHCTREVVGARFPVLQRIIPPILGDLVNLQPSLFALTQVHLIFDDSRARLPPEKGGLGYRGAWSTLQGLHETFRGVTLGFKKRDPVALPN